MKNILVAVFIILSAFTANSQFMGVTENAEFSLITCAPDITQPHAVFGHSALRLVDTAIDLDIVYNYGMFNSRMENFLYLFVKGETYYILARYPFNGFVADYEEENRHVFEHTLNLKAQEVKELFFLLEENAKPENRVYLYSYMFDNCSSRLRDVLKKTLGDKLSWNGNVNSGALIPKELPKYNEINSFYTNGSLTLRQILDLYAEETPWLNAGIYLPIGMPSDRMATLEESMFIPDFLMNAFCHATVERENGPEPFVKSYSRLSHDLIEAKSGGISPNLVTWALAILVLIFTFFELKRRKNYLAIDISLFVLFGVIGVIVWFVSLVSIHPAVFFNYNLFWITPTHFLVVFLLPFKKLNKITKGYFLVTGILAALMLFLWNTIPQSLHPAHFPLVLMFSVRLLKLGVTS